MQTRLLPVLYSIFLFPLIFSEFFISAAVAQDKEDNFRSLFTEAGYHVEYKNFSLALPVYLKMDSIKPGNANVKYRIGLCYLNSTSEKAKAVPWLQEAIKKISRDYDDLSFMEVNAPYDAVLLLAKAYHLSVQLDSAISTAKYFKSFIHKKHYKQAEADQLIMMCGNAKELMQEPIAVEIENLGDSINSPFPDYAPVITADESVVIFTSRRDNTTGGTTEIDGSYMEDVYSSASEFGAWTNARPIGASINTIDHDAAIGLSYDGQILFLYKDDDGDGNIYQSDLMGDIWTVPEKLGATVNSPAWETHASLSADGQTLYFVSDRKDGFGGRDIYRVKKMPDGQWSEALNLGPVINTVFDEDAPFIHPDEITLYFSSKGHKTMGGFDIFYTEIQGDGQWSQPKNIGYPINTVDDDIYLVLSANGQKAYFSSVREKGFGEKDIYKATFTVKEATKLTVMRGFMQTTDEHGNPLDVQVVVTNKTTKEELTYRPNSKTGKYLIILQPGAEYDISYFTGGMKVYNEDLIIPEESDYRLIEKPIDLRPLSYAGELLDEKKQYENKLKEKEVEKEKEKISSSDEFIVKAIKEIKPYQQFFGYNMKDIDTVSQPFTSFADKLVEITKSGGKFSIHVEASASKVPSATYKSNHTLAKIRAGVTKNTLSNYLKRAGIDAEGITMTIDAKVQGPEYKRGTAGNKELYEKYQYVKIIPAVK
ncbi:MAG: PD40 domain-containing protein [Bacteroidetes bacterium]|nr:PD40 domain-containing protein [Bacteroidota bacterium]